MLGETIYLVVLLIAYATFTISLFACMVLYMASRETETRATSPTQKQAHVHPTPAVDDQRPPAPARGWKQQAVALQ